MLSNENHKGSEGKERKRGREKLCVLHPDLLFGKAAVRKVRALFPAKI